MSIKLGQACQITIGTNDANESLAFYKLLGFRLLAEKSTPFNWKKITDGSCTILLLENGSNYVGVSYFAPNMKSTVKALYEKDIHFVQLGYKENIFISPDDTIFTLVEQDLEDVVLPFKIKSEKNSSQLPNATLGIFSELSIPVENLAISRDFYKNIGFKTIGNTSSPYPFCLLYDGNITLGLHETSDLDNHILTYFCKNVSDSAEKLAKLGIENITQYHGETIHRSKHIVIRTPENLQFFLFEF